MTTSCPKKLLLFWKNTINNFSLDHQNGDKTAGNIATDFLLFEVVTTVVILQEKLSESVVAVKIYFIFYGRQCHLP